MIVLGIDPGLTGAVALLCSRRGLLEVADLPTEANGTKSGSMQRWLAAAPLASIFTEWRARHDLAVECVRAFIERPIPMPSLPAQTIASQFDTFGAVRAMVAAHMDAFPTAVAPRDWQKPFALGKGDKAASIATARRLYPKAPITLAKHHNRAEAVLLAHYGMQEVA